MSLVDKYQNARERLRILGFRTREAGVQQRAFWSLASAQKGVLAHLAILFGTSIIVDVYLLPPLQRWLEAYLPFHGINRVLHFPVGTGLGQLLAAIAGLSAGAIGILVSVSLVVIQSASGRYSASVVAYLTREQLGASVLRSLFLTLCLSLSTLFLHQTDLMVPRAGTALTVALAVLSVAGLLSYREQALYLFSPEGLARRWVADNLRRFNQVAARSKGGPGRSVAHHLQVRTEDDLRRLRDLLLALLEQRRFREISETLPYLHHLLADYLKHKQRIPPNSMWFPLREVALAGNGSDWQIRHIYEQLALGTPRHQTHDEDWCERFILSTLGEVVVRSFEQEAWICLSGALITLEELAVQSFEVQELGTLDTVLSLAKRFQEAALPARFDRYGAMLISTVFHLSDNVLKRGLGIERVEQALPSISWHREEEIWDLDLPKVLTDELLSYQQKLATEVRLEGRMVTPPEWIAMELREGLTTRNSELQKKYNGWCVARLQALLDTGIEESSGDIAALGLVNLVLIADRAIVLGHPRIAPEIGDLVSNRVHQVLSILPPDSEVRQHLLDQLRIMSFRAVSARDLPLAQRFVPCLSAVVAEALRQPLTVASAGGQLPIPLEVLLVLGGLAFVASELTSDLRYFDLVVSSMQTEGIILERVAQVILPLLQPGGAFPLAFGSRLILEYLRFFRPIFQAIGNIPTRAEPREGASVIGYFEVSDHPSEFIRRFGRRPMGPDIDDCIEGFLRRISAEDSE